MPTRHSGWQRLDAGPGHTPRQPTLPHRPSLLRMSCTHYIPRSAFRGLACIKCGENSTHLLRCSRCKRVSYCDEYCQKVDYPEHKQFCRAWTTLRSNEPIVRMTEERDRTILETFVEKRTHWTIQGIEHLLGGSLSRVQQQLIIFELRCAICFRTNYDLQQDPAHQGRLLTSCQDCFSVYACSDAHCEILQKTHRTVPFEPGSRFSRCQMQRLVIIDDEEEAQHCQYSAKPIWYPERRLLKYTPLPMVSYGSAWVEWLSLSETQWPDHPINLIDMRLASAPLSFPMTVLYAIQLFEDSKCRVLLEKFPGPSTLPIKHDPLYTRSRLEIHIVGLRANELAARQAIVFEELQHQLPACKHIILRFIGPELAEFPSLYAQSPLDFDDMADSCSDCKASGIIRTQAIHSYVYHEWVQEQRCAKGSGTQWAVPDLVVCFNASMTESHGNEGRWAPTVALLLEMGVPTLVSAFTEKDAESDSDFVAKHDGLITFEPHRNPWRNEQGLPEVCGNDEFYFFNNYVFGFCGRVMKQV